MAWTAIQFSHWFSEGAAAVADDYFGHRWTGAFPPLRLDPTRDPADQIIGHLGVLAARSQEVFERARSGLGIALDHIARPTKPVAVEFMLRLAGALDPPGASSSVLRYVTKPGWVRNPAAWDRAVDLLVRNTFNSGRGGETLTLLQALKPTAWWRQTLPWYLRAVVMHDFDRWRDVKAQYRLELYEIEREEPDYNREISEAVNVQLQNRRLALEQPHQDKVASDNEEASASAALPYRSPQQKTADLIVMSQHPITLRLRQGGGDA